MGWLMTTRSVNQYLPQTSKLSMLATNLSSTVWMTSRNRLIASKGGKWVSPAYRTKTSSIHNSSSSSSNSPKTRHSIDMVLKVPQTSTSRSKCWSSCSSKSRTPQTQGSLPTNLASSTSPSNLLKAISSSRCFPTQSPQIEIRPQASKRRPRIRCRTSRDHRATSTPTRTTKLVKQASQTRTNKTLSTTRQLAKWVGSTCSGVSLMRKENWPRRLPRRERGHRALFEKRNLNLYYD